MTSYLYGTINDTVQFVPNAKRGTDVQFGVKGDWKTVEGEIVFSKVSFDGPEEFATKSRAARVLWPNVVIRIMRDQDVTVVDAGTK